MGEKFWKKSSSSDNASPFRTRRTVENTKNSLRFETCLAVVEYKKFLSNKAAKAKATREANIADAAALRAAIAKKKAEKLDKSGLKKLEDQLAQLEGSPAGDGLL